MSELEKVGDVLRRMFQTIVDPPIEEGEELGHEPKRYAVVRNDGTIMLVDAKKKGAIRLNDEVMMPWMRTRSRVVYRDNLD